MSEVQSINIVEDAEGELRVSSLIIADRTDNQHASVLRIVRENLADFESFGLVGFEIAPRLQGQHGGGDVTYAVLNEPQATLLMTYMRNSEVVKNFKIALVAEFYRMRQALATVPALTEQEIVHQALQITARQVKELEAKVAEDAPKVAYVERFVGQLSDAITVNVFASQFGTTGPKVRELLVERGVAVRKFMGERWSGSKQCMEKEYEWRPRQGVASADWFDLRPQHNAPRLHNGQVKQTMYVRQFHAYDLALKLGLAVEAVA